MGFEPTLRVLLDSGGTNIHRQVSTAISNLEAKGATIREAGGIPRLDLAADVTKLTTDVSMLTFNTVAALDGEIAGIHDQWRDRRDKHPEKETASILRAQTRIGAMSTAEAEDLVTGYAEGTENLDMHEIATLQRRLREEGSDVMLEGLRETAKARRGLSPWLQDDKPSQLADYRESLSRLKPGQVGFTDPADGETIGVAVSDLVDFDGELNAPA